MTRRWSDVARGGIKVQNDIKDFSPVRENALLRCMKEIAPTPLLIASIEEAYFDFWVAAKVVTINALCTAHVRICLVAVFTVNSFDSGKT